MVGYILWTARRELLMATDDKAPTDGSGVADLDDGLGGPLIEVESQDVTDAAVSQAVPLHQRRFILPEGATRADAIYLASKTIPQNEYGLPTFFYRSDFLPFNLGLLTNGDLDNAAVALEYGEGYPTFQGAHIFWHQLPHEPRSNYEVFIKYLEQAEDIGIRQLQLLASMQVLPLPQMVEHSKEYYWQVRARAYDLFQVAADRKRREIRARKAEGSHYNLTSQLLETVNTKFQDPDWVNNLEGKELIQVLETLIKLQRISLGLAANGNAGPASENPNAGTTAEVILRQLTQNQSQDDGIGVTPDLQAMMLDPTFTMAAQELIFRVSHGTPVKARSDAAGMIEG